MKNLLSFPQFPFRLFGGKYVNLQMLKPLPNGVGGRDVWNNNNALVSRIHCFARLGSRDNTCMAWGNFFGMKRARRIRISHEHEAAVACHKTT